MCVCVRFSGGMRLGCVGVGRVSRRLESDDVDSIASVYGDLILSPEFISLRPLSPFLGSLVFLVL